MEWAGNGLNQTRFSFCNKVILLFLVCRTGSEMRNFSQV